MKFVVSVFVETIFFIFASVDIIDQSEGLVELPATDENDIASTEDTIRNTTNTLFSILNLTRKKDNPRLKKYNFVHNYFVSVTLKDYISLKQIAKLSRADNKTYDNATRNLIGVINAILVEDDNVSKYNNLDDDLENYITESVKNIEFMKNHYNAEKDKVLKILEGKASSHLPTTDKFDLFSNLTDDEDMVVDDNEFWNPNSGSRRIFDGKRTKIRRYPFMASVQIFNKFQCGASIIHDDLVITAASCLQLAWNNRFYRENPAFLSVRVGSNFYQGGGENIQVMEVYFHPAYNPKNLNNNLAIMRLMRLIRFKKLRVKKIAIDREDSALPLNTDGILILGWGATRVGPLHPPFEQQLALAILDVYGLKDCQEVYSKEFVTKKNFCAGFISRGGGACNRDVGGPGVVGGYLTGVVSFGSPVCGTPDAPTVFTKVGFYCDWIEEIMAQKVPKSSRLTTSAIPTQTITQTLLKEQVTTWHITPPGDGPMVAMAINTRPAHLLRTEGGTTTNVYLKEYIHSLFKHEDSEQADSSETSPPVRLGPERNTDESASDYRNIETFSETTKRRRKKQSKKKAKEHRTKKYVPHETAPIIYYKPTKSHMSYKEPENSADDITEPYVDNKPIPALAQDYVGVEIPPPPDSSTSDSEDVDKTSSKKESKKRKPDRELIYDSEYVEPVNIDVTKKPKKGLIREEGHDDREIVDDTAETRELATIKKTPGKEAELNHVKTSGEIAEILDMVIDKNMEKEIINLIRNADLKDVIGEIDDTILDKLGDTVDDSILSLLYLSDSEKQSRVLTKTSKSTNKITTRQQRAKAKKVQGNVRITQMVRDSTTNMEDQVVVPDYEGVKQYRNNKQRDENYGDALQYDEKYEQKAVSNFQDIHDHTYRNNRTDHDVGILPKDLLNRILQEAIKASNKPTKS